MFGLFGKKKQEEAYLDNQKEITSPKDKNEIEPVLGKGIRGVKDLFAPPSFDRSHKDFIKVGAKHSRSFVMEGFPATVSVGWLDDVIQHEGDMDTVIYMNPSDERTALDELTAKITQYESQLDVEAEKGSIRNVTRLRNIIQQLYAQRERLEMNQESLFQVQIASNLYADSEEELNKETQKLENKLRGRKILHMPVYLRQDEGYKSVLPFGHSYLPDKFRSFNSGALTSCFPFYNSEISHETGVLCGVNLQTRTPILIDFYDRELLGNSNLTVFGKAGSGKTFFVSAITLRSALKGIKTAIIDPEGEYKKLTDATGGSYFRIAPDSDTQMNPFDIEEEVEEDGTRVVDIKVKVADVLNLIGVMSGGMTAEQRSVVSYVIADVYAEKGFTEDPDSLYIKEAYFDEATGELYHDGMKKPMPTFSDFHEKLEKVAHKENNNDLRTLANALRIFKKGGVYDMFDCQTSESLSDFENSPVVTFDISSLEESVLRPIGMYIALSWTWEKFAKKNPEVMKRVICDEAWMLVNKNMEGHEYTAQFLENTARRIRKRNGGLLVASQNFSEFEDNPEGKAVLTNAFVNIFLQQDATDIDSVQDTFKLSDGERNFLLRAKRGEMLIRMREESSIAFAFAFEFERDFITNPYNVKP